MAALRCIEESGGGDEVGGGGLTTKWNLAVMIMEGKGEGEEEKGPRILTVSPRRTGVIVQSSGRWSVRRSVKATITEIIRKENVSGRCG